jgi:predicted Zn-ribbon and HTH transcriptional regulator
MAVEQSTVYRCEHVFASGKREGETCGHTWTSRKKKVPSICPVCRSPKWNLSNGAAKPEGSPDGTA